MSNNKTFDVAQWSYNDIKSIGEENYNRKLKDKDCEEIVHILEGRFDASIGINWEVIELAVEDWIEENPENPNIIKFLKKELDNE